MTGLLRIAAVVLLAELLVGLSAHATVLEYDLAQDWSDAENPFGMWSLWKSPSALFGVNQPDYVQDGSMRHAWADQPFPLPMHVPVWGRSDGDDAGAVWMHGAEFDRTGTNTTSVTWISPIAGEATIHGAVWQGAQNGRAMRWSLLKFNTPLSTGEIVSNGTYTREHPFDFAAGSGGPGALVVTVEPGDQLELRLVSLSEGGNLGESLVLELRITVVTPTATPDAPAAGLTLLPCAPNPFNPRTTLRFSVPAGEPAHLDVYDAAGRHVRTLLSATTTGGDWREMVWDGLDDQGRASPAGSYLARLAGREQTAMVRMTLVR